MECLLACIRFLYLQPLKKYFFNNINILITGNFLKKPLNMLRIVKVKIEVLSQERPVSYFSQESLDFEGLS